MLFPFFLSGQHYFPKPLLVVKVLNVKDGCADRLYQERCFGYLDHYFLVEKGLMHWQFLLGHRCWV